jgi:hypothetical protein
MPFLHALRRASPPGFYAWLRTNAMDGEVLLAMIGKSIRDIDMSDG